MTKEEGMKKTATLFGSVLLAGIVSMSAARADEVTLDVLYAFPAFAKFH